MYCIVFYRVEGMEIIKTIYAPNGVPKTFESMDEAHKLATVLDGSVRLFAQQTISLCELK